MTARTDAKKGRPAGRPSVQEARSYIPRGILITAKPDQLDRLVSGMLDYYELAVARTESSQKRG